VLHEVVLDARLRDLRGRVPAGRVGISEMSIHIGTAGWNYPTGRGTWNGVFYPARRHKGFDELAYYAERFETVEVNSTFYRMPEPALSASWIRRTPASLSFSIKLFQKFTHPDMYLSKNRTTDWDVSGADFDLFRFGIDPLAAAGRLEAVLVQFPPSFQSDPDTRAYLEWLLQGLADYRLAVELRHHTWSDASDQTTAILTAKRASWVLIDEPKFATSVRQSPSDLARTSDDMRAVPLYLRFHGRNTAEWWDHAVAEDRYNYLYSSEELEPYAEAIEDASKAGRRVLVYFNNHFSSKAVVNAAILKRRLGQLVPGDYPPEIVARYPELTGIVATSGLPL